MQPRALPLTCLLSAALALGGCATIKNTWPLSIWLGDHAPAPFVSMAEAKLPQGKLRKDVIPYAERCEQGGDGSACVYAGRSIEDGRPLSSSKEGEKLSRRYEQLHLALKYYELACSMREPRGCEYAGDVHYFDYAASPYFREADHLPSMTLLHDDTVALSYYTKGCELGHSYSCAKQGDLMAADLADRYGDRFESYSESDAKPVLDTYRKSCDLNNRFGCYGLGLALSNPMYASLKDRVAARDAFRRYCALGNEYSTCLDRLKERGELGIGPYPKPKSRFEDNPSVLARSWDKRPPRTRKEIAAAEKAAEEAQKAAEKDPRNPEGGRLAWIRPDFIEEGVARQPLMQAGKKSNLYLDMVKRQPDIHRSWWPEPTGETGGK
ncbi:MAG: hypothetical protein K6A65_05525 [Succinivibrionaceae bacterium]|nr:hypothetical protein [Succinivibrionaceae bacterium]